MLQKPGDGGYSCVGKLILTALLLYIFGGLSRESPVLAAHVSAQGYAETKAFTDIRRRPASLRFVFFGVQTARAT